MATPNATGNQAPTDTTQKTVIATETASDDGDDGSHETWEEQTPLERLDIACLIINKMIGTGIYTQPALVLVLVGNKVVVLFLWIFGGLYSYLSIYIYLEYGVAWPYNGGEFYYLLKIFPIPPLLFACSFGWVFTYISATVANSLNFAKFLLLTRNPQPDEWLEKFIACGIVVVICFLHYRFVNIGIRANNLLAFGKVAFLFILVAAGFVAVIRDAHSKDLRGSPDFSEVVGDVTAVNVVGAIFLVFYSYQGWENANYVTSEISGTPEQKKDKLKSGALWAITIVTILYISFIFFLLFLLDFKTISKDGSNVAAEFAIRAFLGDEDRTKQAIYTCIALSACGNLVGVIFTNARVKRDIATQRIIPFSSYFSMSSKYGRSTWDGLGTPTGGIVLHAIVTCILIAATRFFPNSTEGQTFIANLYTYSHTILGVLLGIGLPFLKRRMDENQTSIADEADASYGVDYKYKFFKSQNWLYASSVLFVIINAFLAIVPCIPTKNPDGSIQKISSWAVPLTVIPMYLAGALAAVFIMGWCPRLFFKGSQGETAERGFVNYNKRTWIMQYKGLKRQPYSTFKDRWHTKGEAESALRLRVVFGSEEPVPEKLRKEVEELKKQRESRIGQTSGGTQAAV